MVRRRRIHSQAAAQNSLCRRNVSSGSGISLSHRFNSAASCTGFSSHRLTPAGSRSSDSATSCNRRIFPFFRKIPSTAMSATVSVFVSEECGWTHPSDAWSK